MDEVTSLADALGEEFDRRAVDDNPDAAEQVADNAEENDDEEIEAGGNELAPPEHWSEEDKKAFIAMDSGGREWALRLEKNAHKGIEEKSKELKKFREVIEPYRHLIPAGTDETQVIRQLLSAQAYLQSNPVEGVKWLMRNLGVDEKQFSPAAEPDDVYVDPDIRSLKEEIRSLKDGATQRARQTEAQRQNAMLAEIQRFRDEAAEDGTPKHPHFNDVQGVMAGLLQSGRADTMEAAYEQAVWAIPEYRDAVVEQQAKERAERELAERSKTAETAKKKVSVNGKTSAKTPSKADSLSDSLRENYEKSVRGEL